MPTPREQAIADYLLTVDVDENPAAGFDAGYSTGLEEVRDKVAEILTFTPGTLDLVSAADVAKMAGVGYACVSNWQTRHDFPQPVAVVANGTTRLWYRARVATWLAERATATTAAKTRRIERLRAQIARLEGVTA